MLKELKSKFEKKTKSKIDFGAVKTILKGNRGSSKGVNRGSFSKIFFLHEANKREYPKVCVNLQTDVR